MRYESAYIADDLRSCRRNHKESHSKQAFMRSVREQAGKSVVAACKLDRSFLGLDHESSPLCNKYEPVLMHKNY